MAAALALYTSNQAESPEDGFAPTSEIISDPLTEVAALEVELAALDEESETLELVSLDELRDEACEEAALDAEETLAAEEELDDEDVDVESPPPPPQASRAKVSSVAPPNWKVFCRLFIATSTLPRTNSFKSKQGAARPVHYRIKIRLFS